MTDQAAATSVQASIVVDAPIEEAFSIFTEGIGSWWPPEYNLLEVDIAERVFEPRVGGEIYDRGVDGSECHWGNVLVYEPPDRVVISWNLSPHWQVEGDAARRSEVEVRFVAEGAERTCVNIDHRHLDRHGDGWEGLRDSVGSDGGWPGCVRRFGERISTGAALR